MRTRIHADKWSGGSLEKKKKEKEAKTKRGKKVEHNGRRKEWTSLKKPGAERGGGRVGEETEKSSNKETPAAVNIAFASSSSLSMNAASPALIFARAICTRVSRMPVHFLWRDGSKLPREQEFRYVEWRRLFRFS